MTTPSHADELDRLLLAFYQAERPEPFPPLRRLPLRRRWPTSQLSLAASVMVLLATCWLVSQSSGTARHSGDPLASGMAKRTALPPMQP
jgi:hypothetical protein